MSNYIIKLSKKKIFQSMDEDIYSKIEIDFSFEMLIYDFKS